MTRKTTLWLSGLVLGLHLPMAGAAPPVDGGESGNPQAGKTAPKELTGLVAKEATFQTGRPLQPKVIRSQKEALELVSSESVAELNKRVDLSKDSVVLFAWRGSGQDRLKAFHQNHLVLFSLEPGRTKDLREHVKAYAIGKNTHWAIGVSYDEVKSLILKDKVRHAMQLHNRRVTVSTMDGTHYESTEPMLDDIIRFIRENKKDIPIATE